jgi:hypothetical protein
MGRSCRQRKRSAPKRRLSARARAALAAALLAGFVGPACPAGAVPISPWAFRAYIVEGFEGLAPGPDVGQQPGFDGVYLPGYDGAYTFASGVTLIGPNVDVFPGDAFVHDFSSGSPPPNDWGANGVVDGPEDVWAGDAYLAVFEAGTAEAGIDLRFATPQLRVGAFVTGMAGTTVTLDVYGVGDVLLESYTVGTVPLAQWQLNFLGIERPEGIVRVVFRGHDFGLDQLVFEAQTQLTPEPATALLVGLGLAALAARRRSIQV